MKDLNRKLKYNVEQLTQKKKRNSWSYLKLGLIIISRKLQITSFVSKPYGRENKEIIKQRPLKYGYLKE